MARIFSADEVRTMRERMSMTQADLAEALAVSQVTICHWEKGTRVCKGPAASALQMLHESFERTVAAFCKQAVAKV